MGALREREDAAEDRLGTSDLVEISNVMLAMNDEQYERRDEFLQGFRMLPYGVRTSNGEDQMSKMVTTWMEPGGPYVSLKPKSWLGIFKTELSKLSK